MDKKGGGSIDLESLRGFTPGPWVSYADVPSTDPNWHIVTNESRMRVLANVHIEPGSEMDAANARLITAAPDLFAEHDAQPAPEL